MSYYGGIEPSFEPGELYQRRVRITKEAFMSNWKLQAAHEACQRVDERIGNLSNRLATDDPEGSLKNLVAIERELTFIREEIERVGGWQ